MTREEQRNKAAKEHTEQWYKELGTTVEEFPTDANHRRIYKRRRVGR